MRAALDLVLGDLHEAVVVVGEQQLLGLARALRVDALADERRRAAPARAASRRSSSETCGGRGAGRGADRRGRRSARRSRAMCSGVVPQQPPTMRDAVALDELAERLGQRLGLLGEDRLAVRALVAGGRRSGCSGPAAGECSPRKRIASRMSSGPVEQLRPMTSTLSASSVVSTAEMSVPSSILPPLGSSETRGLDRHACGRSRLNASRAPKIAALTSRMSCAVSMMIRSTPPSSRPRGLLGEDRRRARGSGSGRASGRRRRAGGRSGRSSRRRSASSPTALRAISAALRLISSVCSPRPHSSSLRRVAWKVSVSTTSAPASTIDSCTPSMTSGRLSTSASWQRPGQPVVALEGEVELLERGAHAAVEDDDALAGGGQVVAHGGRC